MAKQYFREIMTACVAPAIERGIKEHTEKLNNYLKYGVIGKANKDIDASNLNGGVYLPEGDGKERHIEKSNTVIIPVNQQSIIVTYLCCDDDDDDNY